MKYSIAIYCSSHSGSSATAAYLFANELLKQGHELYRLFFFNDGVCLCADSKDSANLQWQALIEAHQLDAVVCMASAQKRGLQQHATSTAMDTEADLIHSAFSPGGIAQLVDATVQSDRVISFGG